MDRKTRKATARVVHSLKTPSGKATKVRGGIIIIGGKPASNPRLLLPAVKLGDGSV